MMYRNRTNPKVVVEALDERAEYRLGETRTRAVVYLRKTLRGDRLFVRGYEEFHAKFAPMPTAG